MNAMEVTVAIVVGVSSSESVQEAARQSEEAFGAISAVASVAGVVDTAALGERWRTSMSVGVPQWE